MDGLDVLLGSSEGQAAPTGVDVLLGVPVPPAPPVQPTFRGSVGGGAVQGVNDVQNGAAQWLYNLLPQGARNLGDAADHFLYQKTGGAIGTKLGMTFNNAVADQNTRYEQDRNANGRTGIDWARALSGGGTQAASMAVTGVPQAGMIGAGMLSGALMPVTNNGNFGDEKAKDATIGGAFGGLLGGVGNAVASSIAPRVSAAARGLIGDGLSLTPGQMLGGWVKSVEDKLTSVPIVGDVIKGAQNRSVESLNTAAYKRVLTPLSEAGFDAQVPKAVGREGVEAVTGQVQDAYNSIVPKLTFKADPTFASELTSLQQMAQQGLAGPQAQTFDRIVQNNVLKNLTPEGNSSGQTLQGMLSDLGKQASGYASDPSFENRQLGAALLTLEKSIKDGLARTNPEYAAKLSKIDEAFANLTRVQSAAATQGAPNGVFTAAQLSAAVKGGDKTVRDNAFAQGKALMQDLSDPAKALLTSAVPNSGTADRAMTAGAAGALLAHPQNLLNPWVYAGALPALAYAKPLQPLVQKALTMRPAGAQALSEAVRRGVGAGTQPVSAGLLEMLNSRLMGAPQ